jgi:hypothetical protein
MDFQVTVITPGHLVGQEYLEKSGIIKLVPARQGQPLRQGTQQLTESETL